MAQLAIKGHATSGKEVIGILEMLGGINTYKINYTEKNLLYCLREGDNVIIATYPNSSITHVFTLERFLEKFPYKIGDRVRVADYESEVRINSMSWDGCEIQYQVFTDDYEWYSAEELNKYNEINKGEAMGKGIICDVVGTKPHIVDTGCCSFPVTQPSYTLSVESIKDMKRSIIFDSDSPNETELILGDNFEIQVKDGKNYVVRKKPQYPKNYEECCEVLGWDGGATVIGYNAELIGKLQRLKLCRDAYWKIAGNWKPEYIEGVVNTYYTIHTFNNKLFMAGTSHRNAILSFPTEEMRDAFYENFKELINETKELL